MNEVNINNWKKVTHFSVFVSLVFSMIFGFIGYLTFTGNSEGDIFESYCQNDDLMNIVRFIYATIIMFTYPLECFVCREVIENTFFSKYKGNSVLHVVLTAVIVLTTVFLSFITDCLGIVLELNVSVFFFNSKNLIQFTFLSKGFLNCNFTSLCNTSTLCNINKQALQEQ